MGGVGNVGAWVDGWRRPDFGVGDVVVWFHKILAWVAWVEILMWVAWV